MFGGVGPSLAAPEIAFTPNERHLFSYTGE
jgi:hypothetical protein